MNKANQSLVRHYLLQKSRSLSITKKITGSKHNTQNIDIKGEEQRV